MKKENQRLELAREREVDQEQKINQGVAWDRLVVDRRGITLREIGFNDPLRAQPYVYLTSEFTLEPGLLVLLYTRRWGIEKVFDETKNKFNQRKAWATSVEAKETQAHFLCLAHNLTLLFEHHLETAHQVRPEAELKRQQERQASLEQTSQSLGQGLPRLYSLTRRLTQTTYKLVRWLQY